MIAWSVAADICSSL